jgi:hypothetical protein
MATRIHVNSVGALVVAAVLTFATTGQYAFGDNLLADSLDSSTLSVSVEEGGTTDVEYWLVANGSEGCNVDLTHAASVTLTVPSGITASQNPFTITKCKVGSVNNAVTITFTGDAAGGPYAVPVATITGGKTGNNGYNDNNADNLAITVTPVDTTSPVITPTVSGTPGDNGWYISDVTVSWTVIDAESSVSSSTGCGPTTINSDTTGTTLTCSATSEGGTSSQSVTILRDATAPTIGGSAAPAPNGAGWNNGDVDITFDCSDSISNIASCGPNVTLTSEGAGQSATGTAEDNAGNTATATVTGINIDKTAPSITATATPAANPNGWNKDNVVVSFECADALSDIASCPADVNLDAETALAGTLVSGTATDNAGNTMSVSLTIKIDKTAPIISATAIPAPNANGWNNVDVTVEFGCDDALSGVAECPADVVLSVEGSGQSASGTATDNAGNTASITIENINIDKTNPTITGSRTPLTNSFGWNNVDVTVHFECQDSLSDIDSCPADTVLDLEGADQFVTGTAYDKAGNSESDTVSDINIDKTVPTISATPIPAANANGWNNGAVTVQFTCGDALSGVDACPADAQLTSEGAGQSVSGTAYDKAGNSATATATGINIDLTQPTVAITGISDGQSFYFGDPIPAAGCTADDVLSGLDGSCSVGSPAPNNANVGSHTLTAQATDMAGNVGGTTITYTIKAWTLKGFYQPTDKLPTINTVKNGATIPLKWQVFKDSAMTMEITDVAAIKSVASKEVSCSSAPTDAIEEIVTTGGTVLRYDTTAHQYIDNWKTPAKPGKCFDVFMYTQDGSFLNARFQLK